MEITHELKDDQLFVYFSGNIIFEDSAILSQNLDKLLPQSFSEAVLDLNGVTGITSAAIGGIIDFHDKLAVDNRKMRISGLSDKAYTVLKYFKLDQLFPIQR